MNAFAQALDDVRAWCQDVAGDVRVVEGLPQPGASHGALHVHALELRRAHREQGGHGRAPRRAVLRVLVCAAGTPERGTCELLGQLYLAACEHARFEWVGVPLEHAFWYAAGLTPRVALTLDVPVLHLPDVAVAPPITRPPALDWRELVVLQGRLVEAQTGLPIAGAELALVGCDRRTTSDHRGGFVLEGVPRDLPSPKLRVVARGRAFDLPVPSEADASASPATFEVPILEESNG